MLLAHFTVLSVVLLAVVPVFILLRAPAWVVVPLGAALSIATLLALLVDTQVYQLYRFHINPGVMNLLLGGAAQETFDFPASMYLQAAATAFVVILVQSATAWLWWRYVQRNPGNRQVARALTLTLLGAVVIFHSAHIWADATGYARLIEQTDVLPFRHAATAKRSLRSLGVDVQSQPPVHFRGAGAWRSRLPAASDAVPAQRRATQCHRHSHRLVARRCAERASDAQSRSVCTPRRALSRSSQRRQCHTHRRLLALLLYSGYLLAPHAGRARGTGVHHGAAATSLRRARLSQRAPLQSRIRSNRVRGRRGCALAFRRRRRHGARSRSHERFRLLPGSTPGRNFVLRAAVLRLGTQARVAPW